MSFVILGRSRDEPRCRRPIGVSFFAAGIAGVGGIAAVGEWARNSVFGFRAPLSQSFAVAYYMSP